MPQLYYHPQNPSLATDSAKKVRKNRIVAPKRVQMKAPFYILLALALLILQACDIDAAQEDYAAWVTIMRIYFGIGGKWGKGRIRSIWDCPTMLSWDMWSCFVYVMLIFCSIYDASDNVIHQQSNFYTVNNLTKHSTIQNERTYNPQNLSYQGIFDIYNPQFNAKNVMEFDIDEGIVKKVLAEYEKDVAPLRETGYSSENICVVDPYKTVWKEQVISTYLLFA